MATEVTDIMCPGGSSGAALWAVASTRRTTITGGFLLPSAILLVALISLGLLLIAGAMQGGIG